MCICICTYNGIISMTVYYSLKFNLYLPIKNCSNNSYVKYNRFFLPEILQIFRVFNFFPSDRTKCPYNPESDTRSVASNDSYTTNGNPIPQTTVEQGGNIFLQQNYFFFHFCAKPSIGSLCRCVLTRLPIRKDRTYKALKITRKTERERETGRY